MPVPVKEAKLLEGKIFASKIQADLKAEIDGFQAKGLERPSLLAIQAGPDPASDWYIGQQEKLAAKLGIQFKKIPPGEISDQEDLLEKIQAANRSAVNGIFLAVPLPKKFNADEALLVMYPQKDIEGVHPVTLGLLVLRRARLIPPTAYAVIRLIEYAVLESNQDLRGMRATIIGQSAIAGRPVQLLLGERRVTTTVCNTGTPLEDIEKALTESEIVVACAGRPGLVKGSWVRPEAVVIDVGTTEAGGRLVGDIEFEEAKKRASYITPVPGGVGPLTVSMLMQNLVTAYKWQKGL